MTQYLQHRPKSPNQAGPIMERVCHSKYFILMLVFRYLPLFILRIMSSIVVLVYG